MIGQIAAGVVAGDFLVAMFHWLEDTYLPSTTRGPLAAVARDNDFHHFVPYAITSETMRANISVTLPLSAGIALAVWGLAPQWTADHIPLLAAMVVVGVFSNVVHRWIHERPCTRPRAVVFLQDVGVLVSSRQHAEHHENPRGNFGVVLGFTNSVYDGLRVWRLLEAVVPLTPQPKPGMVAYRGMYDARLSALGADPCPAKLSRDEIRAYRKKLTENYGAISP